MSLQGRSFVTEDSRFGYQGSERDPEYLGGSAYTTDFRMLDVRLGRWFSPDPITHPWQSPYVSMNNNPVAIIDPMGLDGDSPGHGGSDQFNGGTAGVTSSNNTGFDPQSVAGTTNQQPTANPVEAPIVQNTYMQAQREAQNSSIKIITSSKDANGNYINEFVLKNVRYREYIRSWGSLYTSQNVENAMTSPATSPTTNNSTDNVAPSGTPTDNGGTSTNTPDGGQTGNKTNPVTITKPKITPPTHHPRPLPPPIVPTMPPPPITIPVPIPRIPPPPPPPSSDPSIIAEAMCWTCWIGDAPTHWNTSITTIIDWLTSNPNYDLDLSSTAGAPFGDTWWDAERQKIKHRYDELINDITRMSGGKINGGSRVHLKYAPGARGTNLQFIPRVR